MGAVLSSESDIRENELLKKFCAINSVNKNDPFWNKLSSYNFMIDSKNRNVQKKVCSVASEYMELLLHNTRQSRNFSTLIEVFIRRSSEFEASVRCHNKIFLWQATNSLLIIRYATAILASRLRGKELLHVFGSMRGDSESLADQLAEGILEDRFESAAEEFINSLVDILISIPVNELTFTLHAECLRILLTLLSTQLYEDTVSENSEFLKYLMKIKEKVGQLVNVLLNNFLCHTNEIPTENPSVSNDSIVISIAASLWSAFSLSDDSSDDIDNFPPQTISSLSVQVLLALVCYPSYCQRVNVYCQVLALFQNAQEVSSLANLEASFKIDYTILYNRLCSSAHDPLSMMMLYTLIQKNTGFKNFILSRVNLEDLIIPVIRILNDGIASSTFTSQPHQTYLALITILICSEDDFFRKVIHETKVKNITWYQTERPFSEISLGGLIILVFVRAIHINILRIRDVYFHSNSLAALANLSSSFKQLSPFVCQKLIGLLESMTKRHCKMIQMMRQNVEEGETRKQEEASCKNENLHRDLTALEEGIRTVLEIINSCLCNNLRHNADLIYSILYKKELFESYHRHPYFQDLIWNIYTVINHFTSVVEQQTSPESKTSNVDSSVPHIMDSIKKAAIEWPTDRLKKLPELNFKYIEDENTVDFFVPYVWRLVFDNAGMYFDAEKVKLINFKSDNSSN